ELHCTTQANNRLEINWGKPNTHFHLSALDSVTCEDNPIIQAPPDAPIDTLRGVGHGLFTGMFNGHKYSKAAATITFVFTDGGPLKGEPGIFDTASYKITLSNGTVVLNTDGNDSDDVPDQVLLTFGNHQAHNEIARLIG